LAADFGPPLRALPWSGRNDALAGAGIIVNTTDLSPCDFWLFPKVKMTMKGSHDSATKDTHERGLPELLQKVARTIG
jgi:hypothetical protein